MINPISMAISGISDFFVKREQRKINKEASIAKIHQMKQKDKTSVTLTDAEAECIMSEGLNSTWKDEYVTILITAPYAVIIVGAIYFVFSSDNRLLNAGIEAIRVMESAGIDMGFLMEAVVLSALALKVWRR